MSIVNSPKSIYCALELVRMRIKKLPTLIDPIIPKCNLVALIGSSDIGKSSLLLQMCIDVTLNNHFLGFPICATHKSSIYVSTEDDPAVLSLRLQRLDGVEEEKLKLMRFIFQTENLVSRLDRELTNQKADLVVIDTFTDIFTKEMNQVNQVRSFMNEYNNLSIKHGCVIIFNHHTGKKAEELEPS
ncbi:MAG: AAA family ATPase [Proteobacteria bacterium]|nr:MAG: AAA family ATPase [Pseudomonadota bacterium]